MDLYGDNECSANLLIPIYISDDLSAIVTNKYIDLYQYIEFIYGSGTVIDPYKYIKILRDILNALSCLHHQNQQFTIIHGDIKPENMLLELMPDNNIKNVFLFDFDGIAIMANDGYKSINNYLNKKSRIENFENKKEILNRLKKVTRVSPHNHNFIEKSENSQPDIYQDVYSLAMSILFILVVETNMMESFDALINDIQHDKKMTYDMIVAYINILFENNFEINKMTEVFGENAVSYKQLYPEDSSTGKFYTFLKTFLIKMILSRSISEKTNEDITAITLLRELETADEVQEFII